MRLKGTLGADEAVIGVHPRVVGGVGAAVFAGDKDPGGRRMSGWIQHRDGELTHRLQIVAFFGYDLVCAPPRTSCVQSEVLPLRFEMKAMRFPSGDQRGVTLSKSP